MAEEFDGKWIAAKPLNGCAACMFSTITCGTWKCFPSSFSGKFIIKEEILTIKDQYYCFCLRPSPIPCCMCCGFDGTPCAQKPRFKKESDTKWVGTGESQLAGGCCTAMFHNKGDVITFADSKMSWHAGTSPAYPPCLQNKDVVQFTVAPWNKGGAPQVDEMER